MSHGSSAAVPDDQETFGHGDARERGNGGISPTVRLEGQTRADEENLHAFVLLKKRREFFYHLLTSLDSLLYLELAAIYYMDCFFFALFLRAVSQFAFLSPKPASVPIPKHQPYVSVILSTNIFCAMMHLYRAAPTASEATRGYLHGSLLIDFIGQHGPTSKLTLLLLDGIILIGQLLALAVSLEHKKMKKIDSPSDILTESPTVSRTRHQSLDIDSEERGLLSRGASHGGTVELQRLSSTGRSLDISSDLANETEEDGGPSGMNDIVSRDERNASEDLSRSLDLYFSGQVVLAHFYILDTVRDQFWAYRNRSTTV